MPILDRLYKARQETIKRGCRALIIAPTRELCVQITNSFETYGRFTGLKVLSLYGGVAYKGQISALIRGVDIIVATPGRLVDHMQEGNLRLNATDILVLDEVDQMLDLGFITPIRKIVSRLPEQRQNLFFSATMPKEIQKFAAELLHNPVRVEVARVAAAQEKVEQSIIHIEAGKKRALLCDLMDQKDYSKVLIFTRTKHGADKVAKHLGQFGVKHGIIHGDKNQNQRQKSLEAFREGRVRTLVATDVAARGIDVAGISHVINFDMPLTPEAYVHRIGRTARAGAIGKSISFCTPQENGQLKAIERLIAQNIPKLDRRNDSTLILDKHLVPDENVEPQTEIIKEKNPRSEGRDRGGRSRDGQRSGGQGRSFEDRAPR
ncbi:MAG: ATP-dependent RNA helicase RhlE, partial [Hyphomonadaceae bacterium]